MADTISDLPDDVLCHILSFLPTEDAVATMILSKRWKPLWPSVTTLDFQEDRYLQGTASKWYSDFCYFVYATMHSRGLHQPIKNFTLRVRTGYNCSSSDVKEWLKAAKKCQVEKLEIWYPHSPVPHCIFRCTTLVVLKLDYTYFEAVSSVHLPSLKTLYMHDVEFVNPHFLMNLLYGCPVLEDLEIRNVYFDDSDLGSNDMSFNDSPFEGQVKSLSNLVRAKVFFYHAFHIPVKVFSNAQFLHLNKCDVDIPVFLNLTYLELSFSRYLKWNFVHDMLNHCPKLQTAVLDIRVDNDEVWPDPGFVPKCFSSHLRKCFIKGYAGVDCQMRFARYVLQNATLLRSMIICSQYSQNHLRKLEMITELTSYPRSSAVCELLFK